MKFVRCFFSFGFTLFVVFLLPVPVWATALDDYAAAPDSNYSYVEVDSDSDLLTSAYTLKLTSQGWRDSSEVAPVVWAHWVTVYKQTFNVFFTNDTALLLIDGGDTSDPQPPYDQDFRDLSFGTGSTIVVLSSVPTWVNHRRYNRDADILPDKPTEVVYVKYTGNPGLNTVRACLHLVENRPTQTRIRVVHGYKIDGLLYRETIDLSQPTGYTVTCDGEPENVFIEISVPSN